MTQRPYTWKNYPSQPIKLGVRATKQMLYLWFKSLPQARRQRIVNEFTRKVGL